MRKLSREAAVVIRALGLEDALGMHARRTRNQMYANYTSHFKSEA